MEQIRRVNRLYTTDSLFLRPTLKIPIFDEPQPSSTGHMHPKVANSQEIVIEINHGAATNGSPKNSSSKLNQSSGVNSDKNQQLKDGKSRFKSLESASSLQDNLVRAEDESLADFLIRIDSSIARTKDHVLSTTNGRNMNSSYSENDLYTRASASYSHRDGLNPSDGSRTNGILRLNGGHDRTEPIVVPEPESNSLMTSVAAYSNSPETKKFIDSISKSKSSYKQENGMISLKELPKVKTRKSGKNRTKSNTDEEDLFQL